MGIFDRLGSGGQGNESKADTPEADALRLIEAGHALEAQGRLEEAKQRYLEAIRAAPTLARAHLNLGNVLLAAGDLPGALDAFKTALKHQPDYAGAYYNIGNALLGSGQLDAALASYRKALALKPDYAEVHCALGVAVQNQGRMEDAVACFRRALEFDPDFVEAHFNLGMSLQSLGRLEDALASYRRTLELKPDFAQASTNYNGIVTSLRQVETLYNRGLTQQQAGQLAEAIANYRLALKIKPDFVEAYNNLGIVLHCTCQYEDAVASYRRALELKPDYAEAHNNLGNALKALGQLDAAAASYRRALELEPDFVEAYNNLGNTLHEFGQYNDALACYRRALKLNPDSADAHNNLGNALYNLGQLNDAVANYRRALEIKPDYAEAHNNLGNTLKDLGQFEAAKGSYRHALQIKPDYLEALSNLLFALNYTGGVAPAYYLEQARQYGKIVADKAVGRFSAWQCTAHPVRLRVGLVSGDLRIHSVGHFLEGLLSHLDPARIELIAYPTHHKEDELTARIKRYFSAWKPLLGKNDEDAARLIHADGVHVLLDISGHTAHNRLPVFAWKPAPVQATWLGLPTTTGVREMDYVLGDLQAIPPEHEQHFSESVWRLPDSYVCFSAPAYPINVAPLPALASGQVTFGSFNNLTKMNDAMVELWARILLSVPNSRLYLKAGQLNDAGVREQTLRRFAAQGIAPERLLLRGTLGSTAGHLAEYHKIDVALDTFPYPGVTTSVEALWMGVPVLSLRGDRFLSLSATSIAHHAGLPDWVAADANDYVAKAVAFTSDLERLAALRAGLRQQVLASPLFDAERFARNFEDALWGMWQAYQDRQGKQNERA